MSSEPRVLGEQEVPDANVHALPGAQRRAPTPQQQITQAYVAMSIAAAASRLMSFLLVMAMIFLSAWAVIDPIPLRLYAAGAFDVFCLFGVWLNGRPS